MSSPNPATRRAVVPAQAAGQRLDRWLAVSDPQASRSQLQRWIDQGLVTVDGRARAASYRLRGGEVVDWTQPLPVLPDFQPQLDVALRLVYQDDDLAVIDKPAGVVVHPAPGHARGTLVQGLLARLDHLSGVGGVLRPGLVHRLDKDTSGLLVVAKNDRAHQSLQEQLRARTLARTYRAICWGVPRQPQGSIDVSIGRHPHDRKRQAVREDGRAASTSYCVDVVLRGAALLTVQLRTGRTHQIRVHLMHLGHPVLADDVYGGGAGRLRGAAPEHRLALKAALAAIGRQALHASRLQLVHPRTGQPMEFAAALPEDFEAALRLLLP
jgi:23S rRNA pseudouridine1911/1915/1917 synthase